MKNLSIALLASVLYVSNVTSFISTLTHGTWTNRRVLSISKSTVSEGESIPVSRSLNQRANINRRGLLENIKSQTFAITTVFAMQQEVLAAKDDIIMYKTPSGLQYRELVEGTGPSPRYGQLVTFSYKGYVSLAGDSKDKKPTKFDEVRSYLTKHGNGRLIAGLDEGLHTMKVGGKRRIIIPPKLGYVESGIGPIPEGWLARRSLNGLLDEMIERQGGRVIFDVELISVRDDEADQGYYDDDSLSPEEFNTLRMNLQGPGASGSGQDPVTID